MPIDKQKNLGAEIAQDNLKIMNNENCLEKFITGNESRVHGYGPEIKNPSSRWIYAKSLRPKKVDKIGAVRNQCSLFILFYFFYYEGLVH